MTTERIELTVRLEAPERGKIRSTVHPSGQLLHATALSEIGADYQHDRQTGAEAILAALERGTEATLEEQFTGKQLTAVGEILFRVLFGAEKDWKPLFQDLFQLPSQTPPLPFRAAVRLRIWTDEAELTGLPWRAMSYKGRALIGSGWTLEVTTTPNPVEVVSLPSPPSILVVAPRGGGAPLDTDEHIKALKAELTTLFAEYGDPEYLQVVETEAQIERAFRGMRPSILYYYGHGQIQHDGRANLLLDATEDGGGESHPCSMDELRNLMDGYPPLAVYLNGCMTGASGWYSAGHQLSADIRVVVAYCTTAFSVHAQDAASAWLRAIVGEGQDPVVALNRPRPAESTSDFQWITRTLHTSYRLWKSAHTSGREHEVGTRLDREDQRSIVLSRISELVSEPARRVDALMSCAAPGNLVDRLYRQLVDHVSQHGFHAAKLRLLRPRFPDPRVDPSELPGALERALRRELGGYARESLGAALKASAPHRDGSSAMPLLWLDWGTFGTAEHGPLSEDELRGWLEFCSELAAECVKARVEDIRVVAHLAVESADYDDWFKSMNRLRDDFDHVACSCRVIPPPSVVSVADIRRYLLSPECPFYCEPTQVDALAKLLHQSTKGKYEPVVKLLQGAQSWRSLESSLKKKPKNREARS